MDYRMRSAPCNSDATRHRGAGPFAFFRPSQALAGPSRGPSSAFYAGHRSPPLPHRSMPPPSTARLTLTQPHCARISAFEGILHSSLWRCTKALLSLVPSLFQLMVRCKRLGART